MIINTFLTNRNNFAKLALEIGYILKPDGKGYYIELINPSAGKVNTIPMNRQILAGDQLKYFSDRQRDQLFDALTRHLNIIIEDRTGF